MDGLMATHARSNEGVQHVVRIGEQTFLYNPEDVGEAKCLSASVPY